MKLPKFAHYDRITVSADASRVDRWLAEKEDPGLKNPLGMWSFRIAVLSAVITVSAWVVFFPFTIEGIRRLLVFTLVTCLVSFVLGTTALFYRPRLFAALGIIIATLVAVTLWNNVG